jgi:hypothetical protein
MEKIGLRGGNPTQTRQAASGSASGLAGIA